VVAPWCAVARNLGKSRLSSRELGLDSILIGGHIVNAKNIESAWSYTDYYGNDLKQLPFSIYTEVPWLDPFETLAFLAAATENANGYKGFMLN